MLTFESAAAQGVGNIIEKLTVSIPRRSFEQEMARLTQDFGTEPSLPQSTAPSRYYRCATVKSARWNISHGYGGIDGMDGQQDPPCVSGRGNS
jgi:hypothetical protein